MNKNVKWVCYRNTIETFERRSTLITGPIKLPYDIIKNPNTKKQLVVPVELVKHLKIAKSSLFGEPLHSNVKVIGNIPFSVVYINEYDPLQYYFLGNIVLYDGIYYLNLVVKNYLRNPLTDTYAWFPFTYANDPVKSEAPTVKPELYGLLNDWTKL